MAGDAPAWLRVLLTVCGINVRHAKRRGSPVFAHAPSALVLVGGSTLDHAWRREIAVAHHAAELRQSVRILQKS
jgi:hypothetical protein